jgi:hypothetical protein
MCHPKKCHTCGKTTWSGCGQHVAAVRASVPAGQWCSGHREPQANSQGSGILSRLLRK